MQLVLVGVTSSLENESVDLTTRSTVHKACKLYKSQISGILMNNI